MKTAKYVTLSLFILSAVLLVLAIVFAAFSSQLENEWKELRRENNASQTDYDILEAAGRADKLSLEALREELGEMHRLSGRIAEKKTEYFKNAKLLEEKALAGETDLRVAYLTFDDGPYDLTLDYLKVLKEYDIRATFFLLGKPKHEEKYQLYVEDGHTLANHTYSHQIKNGIYRSTDAFINDVLKLDEYLFNLTGQKMDIVRFPGGSPTAGSLKNDMIEKLRENGYGYIDWTSHTGDGSDNSLTPDKAYRNLMQTIAGENVSVVLMHDYSGATLGALPQIIEAMKEQNYIFLPLFKESQMVKK